MIDKILILTRWKDVDNISKLVEPYCSRLDICTFDISKLTRLGENYDLIISYCYAPIIKEPFISSCKAPIINIHPTYLPYGRGIYPIIWASLNGDPFGASIHLIDSEEIDSGAIIERVRVHLDDNLTLQEARDVLMLNARSLLKRFLEKYLLDRKISYTLQCNLGGKQAYKNRKQSAKLYNNLPNGWQTTIKQVKTIKFSI